MESEALHQLIVSIDVQNSGQRDNPGQLTLRKVVYDVIETALDAADIPDDVPRRAEDRGDGALLRIDASVSKARVVGRWVEELYQALRERNRELRDPVRLRLGIHAGEVHGDRWGVAGVDVNIACRLASCEIAKATLAAAPPAQLVLAVSDVIYQAVVRQRGPYLDPEAYREEQLRVAELDGPIWLHVPGYATPPRSPAGRSRSDSPPTGHNARNAPAAGDSITVGGDGVVVNDSKVSGDIRFYGSGRGRRQR
jgi:hypothetical protein